MFCPNCGAQNQDTATACAKCGFALKAAASAPKFKGTMLMMNAPPTGAPRPAAPAAPPQAPPAAPPAAAPAAPPAAAPAAVAPKPKLKGTMIGVAPPSLGSNTPPAAPGPAQAKTAAFGAPPAAFEPPPAQPPAPAPSMQQPASSVNPLGGTMVADNSSFGGGFPGAPAPGQGTLASGGGYDPGAPPGYGAPPQQPFAPQQPYAPQQYTQPQAYVPPQQYSPPDALGATAPAGDAQPIMMNMGQPPGAQMQAMGDDSLAVPGTVGGQNPIVTVLLIVLTCGIYGIYLLVKGKKQPS